MTVEEKRNAYQSFFIKSEAGKEFIEKLHELIALDHQEAEKEPARARDCAQKARGIRQVIEHIQSTTAERSKART